jgi:NADH-quinone oxidoreductase subunit M
MNDPLFFPWLSASLCVLVIAALLTWRSASDQQARRIAVGALLLALAPLLLAFADVFRIGEYHPEPWASGFRLDALNAPPLAIVVALSLGVCLAAPRGDVSPRWLSGILLITAFTLITYVTENPLVMAFGWAGSLVPFLVPGFFTAPLPRFTRITLIASVLCLTAGLSVTKTAPAWAFALLLAAVFLRKGLWPVQGAIVLGFEKGPLLPFALLMNGHLGGILLTHHVISALSESARQALPVLGLVALITSAYTALLALVERKPRRLLALVAISQSSFILTGLTSHSAEGIAGALIHWQVVSVSMTMLTIVVAGLEARVGEELDLKRFYGMGIAAPRLGVFFIVAGLAQVGLPLTLGFCAEDLLLHGTLEAHELIGVFLPIVTALNAVSLIRFFAALFLGRPGPEAQGMADALPRERIALAAGLLFLLIGGIMPGMFVQLPARAAEHLAQFVSPNAK